MRELTTSELSHVAGAGKTSCCSCECDPPKEKKAKGNNGWGNGGNDPAPGRSGRTDQTKEDDIHR